MFCPLCNARKEFSSNFFAHTPRKSLEFFFTGLSLTLVPSKEDYFISTSGYSVPKPSIFKIGPEYTVPIEEEEDKGGVFSDVGNFFRTGFDKIKNLVAPNNDAEVYEIHQPHTYSLGNYSFLQFLSNIGKYFLQKARISGSLQ